MKNGHFYEASSLADEPDRYVDRAAIDDASPKSFNVYYGGRITYRGWREQTRREF